MLVGITSTSSPTSGTTNDLAILREKKIKKWRRDWKIDLIEEHNPPWRDLFNDFNR